MVGNQMYPGGNNGAANMQTMGSNGGSSGAHAQYQQQQMPYMNN